jgi:formylglycine-generating enzyme required for sulfatase activity
VSRLVRGGSFYRNYDGLSHPDVIVPATVSDFRLDRFEITVGRFRRFVAAWNSGWRPAAGSGKHAHLNGGNGLANASPDSGSGYEPGWDPNWTALVTPTDAELECQTTVPYYHTWTPSPGANENNPMQCMSWYEAYAFCIWDGGFLPSDAEWNYAASGGSEQRVYPWSRPSDSMPIDCSYANYNNCVAPPNGATNDVGSESPKGDGKYGQADLGGNVDEFALDWAGAEYSRDVSGCTDCFYKLANYDAGARTARGGNFKSASKYLACSFDSGTGPENEYWVGARCARSP